MSSRAWNDDSLTARANAMSCDDMIALARQEHHRNVDALARQFRNPTNVDHIDRTEESKLLRTNGISRNICFEHDPALKAGEYFTQFENTRKERFEQWTRTKDISQKPQSKPTTAFVQPDIDATYFNCHIPTDMMCLYGSTERRTCPPKCGLHPTPCPTPIR
jgi:hypothetical protein